MPYKEPSNYAVSFEENVVTDKKSVSRIIVLRRSELMQGEGDALRDALSSELFVVPSNPVDAQDHLRICRAVSPTVVILPGEVPVPALAMNAGYRHVVMLEGQLMELLELKPILVPFVLERTLAE